MLNLYLLLYLLPRVGVIFTVTAVLMIMVYLFAGWVTKWATLDTYSEKWGSDFSEVIRKRFFVPSIIFLILAIFTPNSQKQIYPFIAFAGLDKGIEVVQEYNAENPESMLNSDGVLEIIDATMGRVNEFIAGQNKESSNE